LRAIVVGGVGIVAHLEFCVGPPVDAPVIAEGA